MAEALQVEDQEQHRAEVLHDVNNENGTFLPLARFGFHPTSGGVLEDDLEAVAQVPVSAVLVRVLDTPKCQLSTFDRNFERT